MQYSDINYSTDYYLNSKRIQGISDSPILDTFFSDSNVEFLQHEIVKDVNEKSNGSYNIDTQSYDELSIIMNFIFEQNSNYSDDLNTHLNYLNNRVIETCTPIIINNITMHLEYVNKHVDGEQWKNIMNYGTFTH